MDDLLLRNVCQIRRNWQMAIYAAHLATGSTLFCRSIRAGTIKSYVHNVATFFTRFPRWTPDELYHNDPRYYLGHDTKFCKVLTSIYDECDRWDKVPDRREPFTSDMWRALAAKATSHHPDSLVAACVNWFACGLYLGFRLQEWAQDDAHPDPADPAYAPNDTLRAFCIDDVKFRDAAGRPLSIPTVLSTPDAVFTSETTFTWQKNGDHGEMRRCEHNTANPAMSYTVHMQQIVQRFNRLIGHHRTDVPLSVYRDDSGTVRSITASDINQVMREVAAEVYHLDPVKHKTELTRWSSHSLRVGACVLLHSMGFTETQLQFLLRWKSGAFMCYLRNLPILARKQNQAIADFSTMPNI